MHNHCQTSVDADMIVLWSNELKRVFKDPLSTDADRLWFDQTLQHALRTYIGDDLLDHTNPTMLHTDMIARGTYKKYEDINELQKRLKVQFGKSHDLCKILCTDVTKSLMRIYSLLSQAKNCLLLGEQFSLRQICATSADLAGYDIRYANLSNWTRSPL